jgi:hypothetical protein
MAAPTEPRLRRCDGCGDAVPADVPVWIERQDGELQSYGALQDLADERTEIRRVWRLGCMVPNAA